MSKHLTVEELEKMENMSSEELSKHLREHYPLSEDAKREVDKELTRLKYFFIHDLKLVGKQEGSIFYVYDNDGWVVDDKNYISDRLIGYDKTQIGSSLIHSIEEITEEQVNKILN